MTAIWPSGNAAWAIELRDLQITIPSTLRSESRDLTDGSAPTVVTFANEVFVDAVGGKIVWIATFEGCTDGALSIVYAPGGAQSASVGCKPVRQGTASCWSEKSSQARYTSQMSIAGDVVTLTGQMTGTGRYDVQGRDYKASDNTQFSVKQKLKLRIVGQTCQVLEVSQETREETIGTISGRSGGNPTHTTTTTLITAGPGAKCTMARRSAQAAESDTDDELQRFDGMCGDR